MAQSDYELAAHVSGLNQRTEINSIFDSILTHNSGSTAPTVTKAFMMWVDTSNATYYYLKMRNHDNTAWVTLGIYTVDTKAYTSYAEDTVKLTGNQTIDGVKTFSTSPIVPTPTTDTQVVNKKYVDDNKEPTWVANDARAKTALNATGTAPIYACRAWVNFNGTGTVSIRASGNVSSITDNGVGDYTVNFTTAMADTNYGINISRSNFPNNIGGNMGEYNTSTTTANLRATSSTRILLNIGATASGQDDPVVSVLLFR